MLRFLVLTTLTALSIGLPAYAGNDDFRLGSTMLLSVGESDAIVKPMACRYADELKIKVEKQGARIEALRVYYKDGSNKTVKVNRKMSKNSETRWIDLGRRKCITKVKVEGYADKKVAEVKLYGRRN